MDGLIKIGEQLLIDRLLSNAPPLSGKSKAGLSLLTVSGLLFVAGLAFLIFGAYMFLLNTYSPDIAALIAGLTIIVLAGLCTCASVFILQYKKHRVMKAKAEMLYAIREIMDIADEEFGDAIADNPKASLLVSTAVGYAVGERFL